MKKLIFALLGITTIIAAQAQTVPASIEITLKNNTTVTYTSSQMDSIAYVGGQWGEDGAVGIKVYLKATHRSVDYLFSQVTNVTITSTPDPGGGGDDTDNNKNRNQLSSKYDASKYMYNLEWPRINETDNNSWSVKSTTQYGVSLSLEWSNSKIANRWTCYQMHAGNSASNVSRKDAFQEDPDLPSSTRSTLSDYSGSGYSRGHLCPSADRLASSEQNSHTFYLSNMQPQWQSHNAGLWERLESQVRTWNSTSYRDTLYVVKAATIEDVTLNGTTSDGIYSTKCNNRLPVPKYFYCALLAVKNGQYQAIGLWTTHSNDAQSSTTLSSCAISIDELERRTGIDFFCNLPDDVEEAVEATYDASYWGL